eukprot:3879770-Prymnesium_polylepis.1
MTPSGPVVPQNFSPLIRTKSAPHSVQYSTSKKTTTIGTGGKFSTSSEYSQPIPNSMIGGGGGRGGGGPDGGHAGGEGGGIISLSPQSEQS